MEAQRPMEALAAAVSDSCFKVLCLPSWRSWASSSYVQPTA